MKQGARRLFDWFFSPELDLRVRLFHILATAGMIISFLVAVAGLLIGASTANILLNVAAGVLAIALIVLSEKTGKHQFCYLITIIAVFFVLFPFLFFSAGGYQGGMPSYFVFAVAFTVFMLDGKKALVLSVLELLLYAGICLMAYHTPGLVLPFEEESGIVVDIITGFVTASVAVGVTLYLHLKLYKDQQKKLARQNRALEEINRMKTEFLGNISHELKTPLTVVSSHIQYASNTLPDTEDMRQAQHYMRLIGSEADRMALMVSQILDVARIEEGQMQIEKQPCSLIEIIQETLDTYYPVFSKNNNSLRFERQGDVAQVLCDRNKVVQVLVNLIGNATRHTRDGEIVLSVRGEGGYAMVTVEDTGEGIAAERIPYLFDRYYSQLPTEKKARTGRDTGTGLGLYISQYIVQAQGGDITVESELGKGTCVRFTLPLDI
ncbi:HAMP domain-containing histidine kinase [Ruminococcaceae bacterium OttesenSCG-928-I18]|nr:HAMP domain-containing histidine kinase [Ruminococcaceae bacterium OttesenSCG-928-I18]